MQIWNNDKYLSMKHGVFEVRGAAGSGKTHQLVKDIHFLHDNGHKNIATISYSNAAVNELSERLGNIGVTPSTIHSFCWKIIGALSRHILDYSDLFSNFHPEGLKANPGCTLSDIKTVRYGKIGIPQFNNSTGELWLSHDDVICLFIESLNSIPCFSRIISNSFEYILIDEYQDTNGVFLNTLFEKLSNSLTIGLYGDPFQTIYLNKQTLDVILARKKYGIKTFYMPNNYRSQYNLVCLYNRSREYYDELVQQPQHAAESEPHVFVHNGGITQEIVSLINKKMDFKDSVVLSVTNGLRMSASGFGEIAKKVKNWIPKTSYTDWIAVLHEDRLSPYVSALIEYSNILFGSDYDTICALFNLFTKSSIQNVGMNSIAELLDKEKETQTVIANNYEDLGLQFIDEIRNKQSMFDSFNFRELQKVNELYASLDDINHHSMTIFASKGLEFNDVILNIDYGWFKKRNWNKINFNHQENDETEIESDIMLYLFYVGITRAKHGLAIFINEKAHPNFKDKLKNKFPELTKYEDI